MKSPLNHSDKSDKTTYKSGATRSANTQGCRMDLIPWEGLDAVGSAMAEGGENHGDYNWHKGMPFGVMINHALQHITAFMRGDNSEDHIGHATANLMMLSWHEQNRPDLDDRGFSKSQAKTKPVTKIGADSTTKDVERILKGKSGSIVEEGQN